MCVCVSLLCPAESRPDLLTNVNMSLVFNLHHRLKGAHRNAALEVISQLFSVIPRL